MGKKWKRGQLYFLRLQNHCRWSMQPWNWKMLAPWKKSYDQPRQYIKNQRHYFADKGPSSQSYGFSNSHVWMWKLTIKKAEHQRIDAFKSWCWRRHLRVPWTARRSNQSMLQEISPEYSLEGLMLKLKLQYFGHLMRRTESLAKTLMLEKVRGQEEKWATEDEMVGWHYWLNGHEFAQTPGDKWTTGKPGGLQFMVSQRVRQVVLTEQ